MKNHLRILNGVLFLILGFFNVRAQKADLHCPFDVIYDRGDNHFTAYFTIFNDGGTSLPSSIDFYLSNNLSPDVIDPLIGSYALASVGENSFLIDSFEFNICPSAIALDSIQQGGNCFLWFQIDAQNLVDESDESNNQRFDSLSLSYNCMLGVDEMNEARKSKIFPNPSNGNFNIDFSDLNIKTVQIDLLRVDGSKHATLYNAPLNSPLISIHQQNVLNSGVYLVRINSSSYNAVKMLVIEK